MNAPAPVFFGKVKNGAFAPFELSMFLRHVSALEGEFVECVIRKQKTQRSDRQNRAYFGLCVSILAQHCGYSQDEMHEALAWKFLARDEAGDPLPRRRSTTSLTVAEFEDYARQIRQLGAEMGCDIPEPNEVTI
jgi:hypothetical protein